LAFCLEKVCHHEEGVPLQRKRRGGKCSPEEESLNFMRLATLLFLSATWALTTHPEVQLSTVTSCHQGQYGRDLTCTPAGEQGHHHGDESDEEHEPGRDGVERALHPGVLLPIPQPSLIVRGKL